MKSNDFFCGAGGFGVGFHAEGISLAGAWDFDKFAVESYGRNVSDIVQQADIRKMTASDVPRADIWTFGFPCQDISKEGKHAGLIEGERSRCFFEIMRLLEGTPPPHKPQIIVAENVRNIGRYLPIIYKEYQKQGYKMYAHLYNTKHFRLPQNRERFFIVGVKRTIEKEYRFPEEPVVLTPPVSWILEEEVDESFYVDPNKYPTLSRQSGGFVIREATKKGFAIAHVGDTINLAHPNSKTRRGRVGKQIAQTILTQNTQVVVLPDMRLRKFTPREYARLQGFPDTYEQHVSNVQFYKQMGNAVSVPIAAHLGKSFRTFLGE